MSKHLQNTGYTYNERGWLSTTQYGAAAQYNGNIAEQVYKASISDANMLPKAMTL